MTPHQHTILLDKADIWRRNLGSEELRDNNRLAAEALTGLLSERDHLLAALTEAEKHFGPFADITINGQHDPDDVRVVALIRAALTKATL